MTIARFCLLGMLVALAFSLQAQNNYRQISGETIESDTCYTLGPPEPDSIVYRARESITLKAKEDDSRTFCATGEDTAFFHGYLFYPANYAHLKNEPGGESYHVTNRGVLYFRYKEKYQGGALDYRIYDEQGNELQNLPVLDKHYGTNWYDVQLIGQGEPGEFYTLEVTGEKGSKKYLRFRYFFDYSRAQR